MVTTLVETKHCLRTQSVASAHPAYHVLHRHTILNPPQHAQHGAMRMVGHQLIAFALAPLDLTGMVDRMTDIRWQAEQRTRCVKHQ